MRSSPRLEVLEDRVVPALFGNPWADAAQITVSFLNDPDPEEFFPGVTVGEQVSSLEAVMASVGTEEVWKGEILRAIQTWASVAGLNVRLVGDSGDAVGTAGASQGDPRFGDIRIGAIHLGASSVATATPPDPALGTWAGDVLFNADAAFSVGGAGATYDLYSIALHEVGHALGLAGNLDTPGSAMFDYYNGPRTGLHRADVRAITALYDAREKDAFEARGGNNTQSKATDLVAAASQTYGAALRHLETVAEADLVDRQSLGVDADLTTAGDVDWFSYQASGASPGFTVTLTTGVQSLAHARLTVIHESGAVVGQETMNEAGSVFVTVPDGSASGRYYFRVEAAPGTAFSVGRYNLTLTPNDPAVAAPLEDLFAAFVPAGNDTAATAGAMARTDQDTRDRPNFFANGSLDHAGDVDVYAIERVSRPETFQATLFLGNPVGGASDGVAVALTLYDANGNAVATRVVANANGTLVIESAAPLSSGAYYLAVAATEPGQTPGGYRLFAQFKLPTEAATELYSDTLGEGIPATPPEGGLSEELLQEELQAFRSLTLAATQLLELEFSNAGSTGSLLVEVYDNAALGGTPTPLFSVLVEANSTARVHWLFGPGEYTFRFAAGVDFEEGETAIGFAPLSFAVTMRVANDPIGPEVIDPSNPPPRDLEPAFSNDQADVDPGIVSLLQVLTDPYGRLYGSYLEKWY